VLFQTSEESKRERRDGVCCIVVVDEKKESRREERRPPFYLSSQVKPGQAKSAKSKISSYTCTILFPCPPAE
jgi:hypothetical protein